MNNIFYNIVSMVIGVLLLVFGITQIVKHNKIVGIVSLVHGTLFIPVCILGFFLPDNYMFITILGMLALAVSMILTLLLTKKDKKS